MPKLYEYFGLMIFFYSNEHEPIHVHARYQGSESRAEIIFINGQFTEIRIGAVKGKKQLLAKDEKKFNKFVEYFKEDIIRKWIDFFVFNKAIESETVTQKVD